LPLPPAPVKPPGSAEEEARLRIEVRRCEGEYEEAVAALELAQDELRWYQQDHEAAAEAEVEAAIQRICSAEMLALADGLSGPFADQVRAMAAEAPAIEGQLTIDDEEASAS
jgi:hypothetical protein